MKGKNLQPRLLYPTRILFKIDREINSLQRSKSLEDLAPPKQLYNKCERNFYRCEAQEKEKAYRTKPKQLQKRQ